MRKHRFFINEPLAIDQVLDLNPDLSHQIVHVLRLQPDTQIFLFNNSGSELAASIQSLGKKTVTVIIVAITKTITESSLRINLGQVLGKGEKMDLVIQKATELGVHSITPLYSEHAVIKPVADRIANKLDHWQKIAIAACCQCGRNIVPTIQPSAHLATWIEEVSDPQKFILSPSSSAKRLRDLRLNSTITILIGPEGGFSEPELLHASHNDFTQISLGPRILRTETAGIATLAILQGIHGDI